MLVIQSQNKFIYKYENIAKSEFQAPIHYKVVEIYRYDVWMLSNDINEKENRI